MCDHSSVDLKNVLEILNSGLFGSIVGDSHKVTSQFKKELL